MHLKTLKKLSQIHLGNKVPNSDIKPSKGLRKMFKVSSVALISIGLSACMQTANSQKATKLTDYRATHPIKVNKSLAEIDLILPKKSGGLSNNQVGASAQFILDYVNKGEGKFEIWQPRGHLNGAAVKSAHKKLRKILYDAGVASTQIDYHQYDADGNDAAPIGLKFGRYVATTKQCGKIQKNMATNFSNRNYSTFGCAYQNNIAAMVSNPRDLLSPGSMGPASAERRRIVWNKYIKGTPTGATRSSDEKVAISKVAK